MLWAQTIKRVFSITDGAANVPVLIAGESKKNESGESDPGYESDSNSKNNKSGIKKSLDVVKVVDDVTPPSSSLFSKPKPVSKPLDIPSFRADLKPVNSRSIPTLKNNFEMDPARRAVESSKNNSHHLTIKGVQQKEKGLVQMLSTSNTSNLFHLSTNLDRLDRSDLAEKIVSSSGIDEMSDMKEAGVTLEIFSPVMVRWNICWLLWAILETAFISSPIPHPIPKPVNM